MSRTKRLNFPSLTLPCLLACQTAVWAAGPVNPFLSAPVYGVTHFDSGQSDVHPYAVKRGTFRVDLAKQARIPAGPINPMNVAAAQPGFMWAVSSESVCYVDARRGGWKALARMSLPGARNIDEAARNKLLTPRYETEEQVVGLAKEALGPRPANLLTGGTYSLADRDNVLYLNSGTVIHAIGLKDPRRPAAGIEVKRSVDAKTFFTPVEFFPGTGASVNVVGLALTYDGQLVVGSTAAIAVVDRDFVKPAAVYTLPAGQIISNSFAVDDDNGIYVASGSVQAKQGGLMLRVQWTGSELSTDEADGGWSSPYEGGNWPPAIKFGTGTGSTPTVMGFDKDKDRLVVITDGADRMHIVAFWRDQIPSEFEQRPGTKSRRIADQMAITAGLPADAPWVQSEQSVVVNGWGAFVVNNIVPKGHQDKIIDVLLNGPVIPSPHGMERVRWDPLSHHWRPVWSRGDQVSNSMVPVASSASGMVFVNGYTPKDGWEVTGLDWNTGKTVHRTILGHGNLGNGAYALLQHLPGGDLLFNSVGGPIRVRAR